MELLISWGLSSQHTPGDIVVDDSFSLKQRFTCNELVCAQEFAKEGTP
jgi:hypothetical protein